MDNVITKSPSDSMFVCHHCDALQRTPEIEPGSTINCGCCGSSLFRVSSGTLDKPLALIMASMIIFVIANIYPIMTLTMVGVSQSATITGTALTFLNQGNPELAAVIWLPSVLIPGVIICGLFYVLFSIRYQMNWRYTRPILIWVSRLLPWGMMDVFFLGILVALVKLVDLADIILGLGFYAFLALIFVYAFTISTLNIHALWDDMDPVPEPSH